MARELRGAPVAAEITEDVARRAEALRARGVEPCLAVVRVGEREDDLSYERGATKRCERAGVAMRRVLLASDCSQEELLEAIGELNRDESVHGVLMFRPLPAPRAERVFSPIRSAKIPRLLGSAVSELPEIKPRLRNRLMPRAYPPRTTPRFSEREFRGLQPARFQGAQTTRYCPRTCPPSVAREAKGFFRIRTA